MGDENCTKKIENVSSFFRRDFHHPTTPPPITIITGPSMGDKNHAEKSKTSVWFFRPRFLSLPLLITITTGLSFAILNLQKFLGVYLWQYRICESRDYDGRQGTKIAAEKIGNVCRTLKKCLKRGQNKSLGQVDRHQAARPSRSIDSSGRLAVWTRLKIEVMRGLLGKVMEWTRRGPGFHSQWGKSEFDFYCFLLVLKGVFILFWWFLNTNFK